MRGAPGHLDVDVDPSAVADSADPHLLVELEQCELRLAIERVEDRGGAVVRAAALVVQTPVETPSQLRPALAQEARDRKHHGLVGFALADALGDHHLLVAAIGRAVHDPRVKGTLHEVVVLGRRVALDQQ